MRESGKNIGSLDYRFWWSQKIVSQMAEGISWKARKRRSKKLRRLQLLVMWRSGVLSWQ